MLSSRHVWNKHLLENKIWTRIGEVNWRSFLSFGSDRNYSDHSELRYEQLLYFSFVGVPAGLIYLYTNTYYTQSTLLIRIVRSSLSATMLLYELFGIDLGSA